MQTDQTDNERVTASTNLFLRIPIALRNRLDALARNGAERAYKGEFTSTVLRVLDAGTALIEESRRSADDERGKLDFAAAAKAANAAIARGRKPTRTERAAIKRSTAKLARAAKRVRGAPKPRKDARK